MRRPSFRSALFGECEFDFLIREDGANFDVPAQGADIVPQRSEFDFSALFEAGDFALLHLHGERNFSLRHLAVPAQFVERHAFENGVGALLCTSAASLGHQLVSNAVVGEDLVCAYPMSHEVIMRCSAYCVKPLFPIAAANEYQGVTSEL